MSSHHKISVAGLLIALGIIYGDIGTSPLYVLNAITNGKEISEHLIIGSLSLIIWTLTLQTTIKYVILTLKADNKGEGGIFFFVRFGPQKEEMAGHSGDDWGRGPACRRYDYATHYGDFRN